MAIWNNYFSFLIKKQVFQMPPTTAGRFDKIPAMDGRAALHCAHQQHLREHVMGQIIGTLFVGLIVGWIARFLLPGKQSMGLIMTSLLGVAGSFAASYAGQFMGWYAPGAAAGWIASVVGAIVLLFVYTRVAGSNS
jgi:uncharacterized membrane protein YeaQ/YmgE (transglycosylase-associated protein family)